MKKPRVVMVPEADREAATCLYFMELKYFAREARRIAGSPMKSHMRVATRSHAEYWTRKRYPFFRIVWEA